ncbi:hypothetical protein KKF34_19245 [Myxococcota bacterium]|nr:hypothetical protein [Myxococcota bacterium]MBU1379289.1 hypothetical protein [Myxococcota bacterium]MBU1499025.1 hypothetical protein [Myxococcota bacterium]
MNFKILSIIFLSFMSGCGFSGGLIRDTITRVEVSRPNFRIVTYGVSAEKSITSVLCIIPTGDLTLTKDLMNDLHKKAGLKKNQMFINLRQDYTLKIFLGFVCISKVTISADVIQFNKENEFKPDIRLDPPSKNPPLPDPDKNKI